MKLYVTSRAFILISSRSSCRADDIQDGDDAAAVDAVADDAYDDADDDLGGGLDGSMTMTRTMVFRQVLSRIPR